MSDIKIVVDSSADLSQEILGKYNISEIPMMSVFGETSYVIGKDMSTDKFYDLLKTSGIHPTTSLTPYATMYEKLLEESKKHKTVIYFTISSKASGQNHSAHLVLDDILENGNPDADIRIVDTMSFSMLIGSGAIKAAEMAENGKSPEEIIETVTEFINKWHVLFVVNDLMYLEKGGRLRKSTAILGSLLDIKPVLTVNDGLIEAETKLRGKKKICNKICNLIHEDENFDENDGHFIILHSDDALAKEAYDTINDEFKVKDITICKLGPLIGTHTGDGIVAFAYRTK